MRERREIKTRRSNRKMRQRRDKERVVGEWRMNEGVAV